MQPYEKYLKENSQKLRVDQTDAERKLWQRINRDQLLGFRFNRQKPLLSYIVDFYCAKAKLIIELDGSQHYEPDYQESTMNLIIRKKTHCEMQNYIHLVLR